jgi:hypothetical protein
MSKTPPPGGPAAGRLRAALAYADLRDGEAADLLSCSKRHLARMKAGDREPNPVQRRALVDATGVPWWFLEHGFAPPVAIRQQDALDRIAALEEHVEADRGLRAELLAELAAVSPSIADRAREAAPRLAGTPPTSPRTGDAEGGAGEAR